MADFAGLGIGPYNCLRGKGTLPSFCAVHKLQLMLAVLGSGSQICLICQLSSPSPYGTLAVDSNS